VQRLPPATATATASASSPATAVAGGPPALGAPLADFAAAYGPVIGHAASGSDEFYADRAETIMVEVAFTSGAASSISVIGPTSWSSTETSDYCTRFLPPGASEYNSVNNSVADYADYHSSLGDLVLSNYGQGPCLVYFVDFNASAS